ncbi:MAG: hypothetical protein AB7N65_28280 [Vicinamibacterales bacterium]
MSDVPKPVPGYKDYLVYCDACGQTGKKYYGFGSLWSVSQGLHRANREYTSRC